MSKLDEKISLYKEKIKAIDPKFDADLLEKITRSLVPSIFNKDAESVSCSDKSELERVQKNFLAKKLNITDEEKAKKAIQEVCEQMGSSNRNKYRAIFYYLLVKKFGKEDLYS